MKALVVGGTGFIGMNVARRLVAEGHDVVATRRPHGNTLFARRLGARLVHASLDDEQTLASAMKGRDVVFMCAGHYPRYSLDRDQQIQFARAQVRNTLNAALQAGVQRYVLTSTVATIGAPRPGRRLSDEQDAVERRSLSCVYHAVKSAIQEEVLEAGRKGLDVVVLCPTAVFGELDVKAGTGFVVVAIGNNKLPFHVEGLVNVVDADDLARAHVLSAEHGRRGEIYIIGGHNTKVRTVIDTIAATLHVPIKTQRIPVRLASLLSTASELRVRAANNGKRPVVSRELVDMVRFGRWVDTAKAERELGLAAPTPLATTLGKSCNWYIRHRYVPPQQHSESA